MTVIMEPAVRKMTTIQAKATDANPFSSVDSSWFFYFFLFSTLKFTCNSKHQIYVLYMHVTYLQSSAVPFFLVLLLS